MPLSAQYRWILACVACIGLGALLATAFLNSAPQKDTNPPDASPVGQSPMIAQSPPPPDRTQPLPMQAYQAPPPPSRDGAATGGTSDTHRKLTSLDQKFRAENVNAAWAAEHEQAITDAIVGTETDGFEVPLPEAMSSQCRSTMCSVRMTYRDEDAAANMHAKIMLSMPKALSKGRVFFLPNQGGGVEMVMFLESPGQPGSLP